LEDAVLRWITEYGYFGIFSLLVTGIIGLPVPDETLLTFSGYLVFKGELRMVLTIISAFSGSICGISISYCVGRGGGLFLVRRYGPKVHITEERIERVRQWLNRHGKWGLTFGYFIPGVRHLAALVAGTSQLKYPVFAAFAYSGGLLWASTFIAMGYFFGKEWVGASDAIHKVVLIAFAVVASILLLYYLARRWIHKHT
jgi:membrane protein DedA with SNARE-associated domain